MTTRITRRHSIRCRAGDGELHCEESAPSRSAVDQHLLAAGQLVPRLDSKTFALGEVNDAYELIENGSAAGKVVVLRNI